MKKNNKEMIKVENICRDYSKFGANAEKTESIRVLNELSFSIEKQEFVGIMGKSGCGKTTLLKVLGLIDRATSGSICFQEKEVEKLWDNELSDIRRRDIGFVFQDYYLMDSLTVRENIMLPMVLDKQSLDRCMEQGEKYAEHFGLTHLLNKYPYELSGGEKQRVAISRALINNPNVILADEPTGNLDSKSGKVVVDALKNINEKMEKTVIMVTHDPQIASYCNRIIFLKDGKILKDIRKHGEREEFYQQILEMMVEL